MYHRSYAVICAIFGAISLADITIYNWFNFTQQTPTGQFWTKLIPVGLYLILSLIYLLLYDRKQASEIFYNLNREDNFYGMVYTALTANGLFLCWLGDFLLAFYLPDQSETEKYFYTGGLCFFLARTNWTVMLWLRPEKGFRFIYYSPAKLAITIITITVIATGFGVYLFLTNSNHLLGTAILLYYIFGFGPLTALAYLRIGRVSTELVSSCALAFAGFLLFNFSDTVLFFALLSPVIPVRWSFLSNNVYWIAMYLISLSVARSNPLSGTNLYVKNDLLNA